MREQLILIVERSGACRQMMTGAVARAGAGWLEAEDGSSALRLIRAQDPTAVMISSHLPDMRAQEVGRRAREAGYTRPVFILTDLIDEHNSDSISSDGMRAIQAGERVPATLVADAVFELLGQSAVVGEARMRRFGRIVLDRDSRRAYCDGRDLCLTRSEFYLLEHLSDVVGQVVARETLLRTLEIHRPPHAETPSPRAIDAHVSNLRTKLNGGRVEVAAVHGFGYRLCEVAQIPEVSFSSSDDEDDDQPTASSSFSASSLP